MGLLREKLLNGERLVGVWGTGYIGFSTMANFAAVSSVITTIGRSGFGIAQALSSRYTPVTVLGIVGLCLLAVSVSRVSKAKSNYFGVHALLVVFLLGLIISYSGGWQAGRNWRNSRETGVYVLKTYKMQSDENMIKYLYPDPAIVRELAPFLEQHKLNVFSQPNTQTSTLIILSSNTSFALDTINGEIVSQQSLPIIIDSSRQKTITIGGWAIDKQTNSLSSGVFVDIDGKTEIPTIYGLDRHDVANHFKNPNYGRSSIEKLLMQSRSFSPSEGK